MSRRTWIYIIILIVVLAAGGAFFWWMYKTSKIAPKAEVTPTPAVPTFTDVSSTYWAYIQIEAVNKAGYMLGYHEFKPDQDATRADVTAAIGKAYSKTYDNPTPSFTDVPTTHWAYQYIEGLKQAGWVDGYPDGTFKPDQAATRADLAIFIAAAAADGKANVPDPGGNVSSPFSDVATSDLAFKYIFYDNQNGIMTGYPDGTFKPTQNATRADTAAAVAKAKSPNLPQATTVTFTDVPTTHWAYNYIEYVNSIKVMVGYPPLFKPDDFADRASVAVAIARAVAGSDSAVPAGPATPSYSDVSATYWAYRHIEYLKTKNIMQGYGDGTFRPDEAISASDGIAVRFTIAVVLARAKSLDLSNPPATASFVDVPATYQAFKEIEAIYKAGYTVGCRQDTSGVYFCPDDQLTRATLAVFVYNAYLKTTPTSPAVVSPAVSPVVSPKTPTPSPTVTVTPTPSTTLGASPAAITPAPAKTGAEVPLAGGGVLGLLFLVRYLVGKRLK